MRTSWRWMTAVLALAACALGGASAAAAESSPKTVALDWAGVPQELIDRCGLGGLENLLLAAIIDTGFAVVADSGSQQVTLELRGEPTGITVAAKPLRCVGDSGDCVHRGRVPLGRQCDSTIAIEITRVAKEQLRATVIPEPLPAEAIAPPAYAAPRAPAAIADEVAPSSTVTYTPRAAWHFAAGLGVSIPSGEVFAPLLRFELARDLTEHLVLAGSLGTSVWHKLDLWIFEPTAGLQLKWRARLGAWELAAGAGADLLVHTYKYTGAEAGALLTGRAGVPLELTFPHLPLTLAVLPNVRFETIRHRVFDDVAFASGRFGCDLALKWVF